MGWESRSNGSRRYTRTHRVPGGGFRREYVGGGIAGEAAAALDAEQREQRAAERERWRATTDELDRLDAHVAERSAAASAAVAALLTAAGYHQHARGAWRRRRHGR